MLIIRTVGNMSDVHIDQSTTGEDDNATGSQQLMSISDEPSIGTSSSGDIE